MRTVPAIPIALLLMMSGCHARRGEFSRQDEAAVRAVADSAVQYQLSGNWDAWAGLFSDDGILHPPNGPALKGRAALLAWARTLPTIQKAAFTDVRVWGDANLAYGTSGYILTLKGMPSDTGKQLWVSRRNPSGKWQVVAVSFNSDLAGRAGPGSARERR